MSKDTCSITVPFFGAALEFYRPGDRTRGAVKLNDLVVKDEVYEALHFYCPNRSLMTPRICRLTHRHFLLSNGCDEQTAADANERWAYRGVRWSEFGNAYRRAAF